MRACSFGARSGALSAALKSAACLCFALLSAPASAQLHRYVDPLIGSAGDGNVTVGPSRPFGMVKPGPENANGANSGWRVDPSLPVTGFTQVHVSGTGGGAKYGNIALMPFTGALDRVGHPSPWRDQQATLGYYAITLAKPRVRAELTASAKVAYYRFAYAAGAERALQVDAGAFLNEPTGGVDEEAQFLVGSEIELVSPTEARGYNRVRGGWNRGGPYTVYFYAMFDQPVTAFASARAGKLAPGVALQADNGDKTALLLGFGKGSALQVKVGISFVSSAKARQNLLSETPYWQFDRVLADTRQAWESLLARVELAPGTPQRAQRMLYTGLYHTMLMPVERTGENPLWHSTQPYYDDFYAVWDTFRSSSPLLTLIDPARQASIVNAMLDIYQHDGYLPDARSGNANGRTQGGSNAEVVLADAYVKGLKGIDYKLALEAMLKDADVAPGGNEEQEGRGGLADYNRLGYVSSNYPRAGTRTLEYAYNDFNIATVARGLGRTDVFDRFARQAGNWQNLWRPTVSKGTTGFIMPRDAAGAWIDTISCTVPGKTRRAYAPTDIDTAGCVCWWCGFLYEASSWEYSLYVPHDVAGLMARTGGADAFRRRLDTYFDAGYYNVGNEPSFFSPNLYHWLGRPDLSSARIGAIVARHFHDGADGIPGNDDSGAMSSWLVLRMLGLYPNAGQSYYLISSPLVAESTLHLADGRSMRIVARGWSEQARTIQSARLNGKPLARAWIEHAELEAGGVLELEMGTMASAWGSELPPSLRFGAAQPQ